MASYAIAKAIVAGDNELEKLINFKGLCDIIYESRSESKYTHFWSKISRKLMWTLLNNWLKLETATKAIISMINWQINVDVSKNASKHHIFKNDFMFFLMASLCFTRLFVYLPSLHSCMFFKRAKRVSLRARIFFFDSLTQS